MKTYLKIRKVFCFICELLFMPIMFLFAFFILLIAGNI